MSAATGMALLMNPPMETDGRGRSPSAPLAGEIGRARRPATAASAGRGTRPACPPSVEWHRLGELIEQCDERNEKLELGLDDVMGMNLDKEVIPTKANLSGNDLSKFKIVHPREFIYNPRTHGKRIGLGYNFSDKDFLISWNNTAFRINSDDLDPLYLYLYFNRAEWDREACYNPSLPVV